MKKIALVVASTLLFSTVAIQNASAQAGSAANQDFMKFSESGRQTLIDVTMARIALFNGQPGQAEKLIAQAKTSMQAAQKENSAYLKDSAKLVSVHGAASAETDKSTANKGPIPWLPVGGDVTITDDYASNPAKAKAVAAADEALKKGDRDGAVEQLKLANVNVLFSVDVIPMQETQNRIEEASGLLTTGKYYEAGQVMRRIQDSMRIDALDISTLPKSNTLPKKK